MAQEMYSTVSTSTWSFIIVYQIDLVYNTPLQTYITILYPRIIITTSQLVVECWIKTVNWNYFCDQWICDETIYGVLDLYLPQFDWLYVERREIFTHYRLNQKLSRTHKNVIKYLIENRYTSMLSHGLKMILL